MAVTTNNDVRLTVGYTDFSTHSYTFSGIPDSEVAGIVTRAQAANQNWVTNAMDQVFAKKNDFDGTSKITSSGIKSVRITSTEEEVIFDG